MKIQFGPAAVVVLLCVAGLHAFAILSGSHTIHNSYPAWVDAIPTDKIAVPASGIDFDRMTYGSPSTNASKVNVQARDEIKRQQCTGPNCSPVPLAPGERYVPGSLRIVPTGPTPKPPPSTPPLPSASTPTKSVPPNKALYQIALFVNAGEASNMLQRAFATDANLAKLKSRVGFQVYNYTNAIYQSRYKDLVSANDMPAIVFTSPDGGVIYASSVAYESLPELYPALQNAFETYRAVQEQPAPREAMIEELCPDGECPLPQRDGFLPLRRDNQLGTREWFKLERLGWGDQLADVVKSSIVLLALGIAAVYLFRSK